MRASARRRPRFPFTTRSAPCRKAAPWASRARFTMSTSSCRTARLRRSAKRAKLSSVPISTRPAASSWAITATKRRPAKRGAAAYITPATPHGAMKTATSSMSAEQTMSSSRPVTASAVRDRIRHHGTAVCARMCRHQRSGPHSRAGRQGVHRAHKGHAGHRSAEKEIQTYVKTNTAPYKYPRIVEFRDELPKTISGKIRRVELKG